MNTKIKGLENEYPIKKTSIFEKVRTKLIKNSSL